MRLLAFDTSTERLAAAAQSGDLVARADGPGGAQASARLLPCLGELLAQVGLEGRSLDAIAFGRGPGAFTGLRTSCAVAQGLALGWGRPVLPIDSLLIVAEDARAQVAAGDAPVEIAVAMDARMGELYVARYRWDGVAWQVSQAPALATLDDVVAAWSDDAPAWIAGSALMRDDAPLLPPAATMPVPRETDRAGALLRLAAQAWAAGAAVDAAQALPLYLRDKVALTTREREARAQPVAEGAR